MHYYNTTKKGITMTYNLDESLPQWDENETLAGEETLIEELKHYDSKGQYND